MSLLIFTLVKIYIKQFKRWFATGIILLPITAQAGWSVDFSRRQDQMGSQQGARVTEAASTIGGMTPMQDRGPASVQSQDKNIFERVFDAAAPTQDIVIINTEQGFMPNTVRVKEGAQYRLVVVNVNEKARNVSFVLDAFSEHHATFYGQVKTFYINPKKEGVYTFLSPETSAQGRLVVHPSTGGMSSPATAEMRSPAAE